MKEKYKQMAEKKNTIKNMYINGKSARDIGNSLGCTHTYVLRLLRTFEDYESFKHKRTASEEDRRYILENFDILPIQKMCSTLKLSKRTVEFEYFDSLLWKERRKLVARIYKMTEQKDRCIERMLATQKFRTLFKNDERILIKTVQRYIDEREQERCIKDTNLKSTTTQKKL